MRDLAQHMSSGGAVERRVVLSLAASTLCVWTLPTTFTILFLSWFMFQSSAWDSETVYQYLASTATASSGYGSDPAVTRPHRALLDVSTLWSQTFSPLMSRWLKQVTHPPSYVPSEEL